MPLTHVCIGTKRGTNHGNVYAPSGAMIGRAFRKSQKAAGTRKGSHFGICRPFYTAELWLGGQRLRVPSLGTRHESRAHAARAVRLFWDWWEEQYNAGGTPDSYHVQTFKWEQREVCALDKTRFGVPSPALMVPRGA